MLLILTPRLTNRLGYTLNVIFRHLLHCEFSITTDEGLYRSHGGARLNYGAQRVADGLFVKSAGLLFETSIEEQEPRAEQRDGQWQLFPVHGRDLDFGFDLFAATFYMVSRYEEYLPHRVDAHQRFCASESLAGQAGFLEEPVVEQWAAMLQAKLAERYPDLPLPERQYRFVQTVDIDAAWCYLHKGVFRTLTGATRDLVGPTGLKAMGERLRVLAHRAPDPYDTFDYIIDQKQRRAPGSFLIFFALLADYSRYDKPASHFNPHMRQLVQHLGDYAKVGIHPGYYSLERPADADEEIRRLEGIVHRTIVRARFHFLRLNLPRSYRILLHTNVRHDYTMGFADAPGFRAGISSPYPFYDMERDHETELLIHPFCVMDTTLKKYLSLSAEQGLERYARLIGKVRQVGGTFCCIVHNQNLGEKDGWGGWRGCYEQMLDLAKP